MNEQQVVIGVPNSEWFQIEADALEAVLEDVYDPDLREELNHQKRKARFRSDVEKFRETMQSVHPDIEFPPVEEGDTFNSYDARILPLLGLEAAE